MKKSQPTAAEIKAAQQIFRATKQQRQIDQLNIQEIQKTKKAIIWDYELYIVETILLIIILLVIWLRSYFRQRSVNKRFKDVIDFVNRCRLGPVDNGIPYNNTRNQYQGPDGETVAYYYVYPHSFLNPFQNINYPGAVILSYYSNNLSDCFTHVGDYMQIMLTYSELNGSADSITIICQTYANPYADPEYFCPSLECRQVCRPVGQESLIDAVAFWGTQFAFVGVMGQKAGSKVFSSTQSGEEAIQLGAKGTTEAAQQGVELTEFASEPLAESFGQGSYAGIELSTQLAEMPVEAPEFALQALGEGTFEEAAAPVADVGLETTAEGGIILGSVEEGAEAGFVAGTAEPGGGNIVGAAVGATVGLCIGIGIAVGFHMAGKSQIENYCEENQDYCIETAETGCPEEE